MEDVTESDRLPILHGEITAWGGIEQPDHDGEEQAGSYEQDSDGGATHTTSAVQIAHLSGASLLPTGSPTDSALSL